MIFVSLGSKVAEDSTSSILIIHCCVNVNFWLLSILYVFELQAQKIRTEISLNSNQPVFLTRVKAVGYDPIPSWCVQSSSTCALTMANLELPNLTWWIREHICCWHLKTKMVFFVALYFFGEILCLLVPEELRKKF